MANTRLPNPDRPRSPQGEGATHVVVARSHLRRAATANDNVAPPLRRMQRALFAITAALAVAWLFWVGFLR